MCSCKQWLCTRPTCRLAMPKGPQGLLSAAKATLPQGSSHCRRLAQHTHCTGMIGNQQYLQGLHMLAATGPLETSNPIGRGVTVQDTIYTSSVLHPNHSRSQAPCTLVFQVPSALQPVEALPPKLHVAVQVELATMPLQLEGQEPYVGLGLGKPLQLGGGPAEQGCSRLR